MQTCPDCGGQNQDAARFCSHCGQRMSSTLPAGAVLQGRYRITRLLGQGGMGAVYQAEDSRLGGRRVAVKENFDASIEAQEQFRTEATTLANLSHQGLPGVSDHFVEPSGKQYLVMDYVEGDDLQQKLDNQGCLPEGQVLAWMDQVCDALEYLHGRNPPIIHRDIKPANIKIHPGHGAMLVDFGIAKVYRPGMKTQQAARAVTPGFSPPEQYGGASTDTRSDIYALGATIYTLITGRVPPDAMDRLTGDPLVAPQRLLPTLSASTQAAVLHALQTQPNDRPQTVRAFRRELMATPRGQVPLAPTAIVTPGVRIPPAPAPAYTPAPAYIPPVAPIVAPHIVMPLYDFASFGQRLGAEIIDNLIVWIAGALVYVLMIAALGSEAGSVLASLTVLAGAFAYYAYFHSHTGQTPGKKALGIKVIAKDGSLISGSKAIARYLVYSIEWALVYFLVGVAGLLWMLVDSDKQCWHDKVCGTYVVRA